MVNNVPKKYKINILMTNHNNVKYKKIINLLKYNFT